MDLHECLYEEYVPDYVYKKVFRHSGHISSEIFKLYRTSTDSFYHCEEKSWRMRSLMSVLFLMIFCSEQMTSSGECSFPCWINTKCIVFRIFMDVLVSFFAFGDLKILIQQFIIFLKTFFLIFVFTWIQIFDILHIFIFQLLKLLIWPNQTAV